MDVGARVVFEFGPFRVDPDRRLLLRDGRTIALTPKAFDVLMLLLPRGGQLVTKTELMDSLWPHGCIEDGNLSQNVFVLRKALGDNARDHRYIVTLPGRGYRFVEPVRAVAVGPDELVIHPRDRSQIVVETLADRTGPIAAPAAPRRNRLVAGLVVAGLVVVAALAIGAVPRLHSLTTPDPSAQRVVFLQASNETGDPAFDGILPAALRLKLADSPYLSLVPQSSTSSPLRSCIDGGGDVSLVGRVARVGDGYRVDLDASDCGGDTKVASVDATATSKSDLLAAIARAADAMRAQLGEPARSIARFDTPLEQAATASLAALKAFGTGEALRSNGADFDAARHYQIAVDLDPEFAVAYARLATIQANAQEVERARALFTKAYALRRRAGERDRLYIAAHYHASEGELDKLVAVYLLWRDLYPRDVVPANNLVEAYLSLGTPAKALQSARDAARLEPAHGIVKATLMRALRRAGEYEEAKSVYVQLVDDGRDGVIAHLERTMIAGAESDMVELQRQLDWARGKPQEAEVLNAAALIAAGRGQRRLARELFARAAQAASSNGLADFEAICLRESAEFAAAVGVASDAQGDIERALAVEPDSRRSLISAAFVFASLGMLERSDAFARRAAQDYPADFALHRIAIPTIAAVASLRRQAPDVALRELAAVEPYDLSWDTELEPIYVRGLAYLQAHRSDEAAGQFARLLEHARFRPDSPLIALSRLGLARAAVQNDAQDDARAEYERFFALWKDADPDVPVLRIAQEEYRRLRPSVRPGVQTARS